MNDQVKKMERRDDGFVEIVLKRIKDFDDYVFSQINASTTCFYCLRDQHSKTKVFFDTKGYFTLEMYLKSHVFEGQELLSFLIYLFEHLIRANTNKPVMLSLEWIFLQYQSGECKFLALPVTMERWVFQKEQSKAFVIELITYLRIEQGYASIGYLVSSLKQEEVSFPLLLKGLLQLQEEGKPKPTFLQRWLKKEKPYIVQALPTPPPLPVQSVIAQGEEASPLLNETMVLFAQEHQRFLIDQQNKQVIVISEDSCYLGRDQKNDVCIPKPVISTRHALIKHDVIEDLQSSNGTFVNGVQIHSQMLKDGDCIRLADYEFVIHIKDGDDAWKK